MKVFLSISVYLALVVVLGFVLAKIAPRERFGNDGGDDET